MRSRRPPLHTSENPPVPANDVPQKRPRAFILWMLGASFLVIACVSAAAFALAWIVGLVRVS